MTFFIFIVISFKNLSDIIFKFNIQKKAFENLLIEVVVHVRNNKRNITFVFNREITFRIINDRNRERIPWRKCRCEVGRIMAGVSDVRQE